MADIQPTLDLIDGAIEDYLSPDAMRWTPDESERAEAQPDRVRGLAPTPMWMDDAEATTFVDWIAEQMRQIWREQEPPVVGSAYGQPRGIISVVPTTTAAPTDILGDIRRFYEGMMPEYELVAPPSFASRYVDRSEFEGITVHTSNVVPDGQVYVINSRSLAEAQREALSNISFVYDTTPMHFDEDLYRFPVTAWMPPLEPFQCRILELTLGGGNMYVRYQPEHRRTTAYRRSHRAGYTPPRDNPRLRALNLACRRRQLARRRRNR